MKMLPEFRKLSEDEVKNLRLPLQFLEVWEGDKFRVIKSIDSEESGSYLHVSITKTLPLNIAQEILVELFGTYFGEYDYTYPLSYQWRHKLEGGVM